MVKLLLATFMPRLSRPFTMCLVEIFIKLNWFDLLFKIQSDIKLFMSSPVLRQYARENARLFFVAGMIALLLLSGACQNKPTKVNDVAPPAFSRLEEKTKKPLKGGFDRGSFLMLIKKRISKDGRYLNRTFNHY